MMRALARTAAGHPRHQRLRAGRKQACRAASSRSSCRPTRRRWGRAPRRSPPIKAVADELERYPDGPATALRNAIARRYGLNPERIVCGAGSDELLNLLAHAYLGAGRRGDLHRARLSHVPDRHAGERRDARAWRRRRTHRADVDAILARVTEQTKVVFLANPEQSDRHLPADRRGAAPARGAAAQRAAGAGCGLCRVRAPQRLRGRAGAGRHHREHGDDAHVLQDLRAGGAAARLGLLPGRRWPTCSTACAGRST